MIFTLVFGVLIYRVQRDVSEEDTRTRKAITKILIYYSIKLLLLLVQYVAGAVINVLRSPPRSYTDVIVYLVIEYTVVDAVYGISSLMTPIMSLIILKPLHNPLKLLRQKLCFFCKQNVVQPAPPSHPDPLLVAEVETNNAP